MNGRVFKNSRQSFTCPPGREAGKEEFQELCENYALSVLRCNNHNKTRTESQNKKIVTLIRVKNGATYITGGHVGDRIVHVLHALFWAWWHHLKTKTSSFFDVLSLTEESPFQQWLFLNVIFRAALLIRILESFLWFMFLTTKKRKWSE